MGFLQLTPAPRLIVFERMGVGGPSTRGQIIISQDKSSGFHREPVVPSSGEPLAANERPAPIEILSPAKRAALVACLKGGGTLHKRYGVWVSEAAPTGDKPVSGMTVADLGRDGMLTLTVLGKSASAQITTRGSWFVRTVAAEIELAAKRAEGLGCD